MKFTLINKLRRLRLFNIRTDKIKKIPWILGLHAFWIILFFVFIELIIGGFLFYKYAILVKKDEQKIADYNLKFKKIIYQKVLEEWQKKSQEFEGYQTEQYLNPFITIKTKETVNPIIPKAQNPVIKQ